MSRRYLADWIALCCDCAIAVDIIPSTSDDTCVIENLNQEKSDPGCPRELDGFGEP